MATATRPVDAKALRLERDHRFDAGETTAAIDADFRARGIDPRTLRAVGRPRTGDDTPAATGRQRDAEPATAAPPAQSGTPIDRAILEDRYDGLMVPPDDCGFTKLGLRLVLSIEALALGTARGGDLEAHDSLAGVVQDAVNAVRAIVIDSIESRGIAR